MPASPAPHVALLRGINVGGKNLIGMADLAAAFTDAGYERVRTHAQSGNVLFATAPGAGTRAGARAKAPSEAAVERMLEQRFGTPIPVVLRSRDALAETIAAAPADHGSPELRSEIFFLKHPLTAEEAMSGLPELRDGVDVLTPGPGALYFSRVAAQARTTRITRLMALPVFQRMTVRTWRTSTRLLELLDKL